jgi:hypothetical protein
MPASWSDDSLLEKKLFSKKIDAKGYILDFARIDPLASILGSIYSDFLVT